MSMDRVVKFSAAALLAAGVGAGAQAQLTPQRIVAVLDGTQNFGTTQRSISFYDVTEVGTATTSDPAVFGANPLFTVWTGFEAPFNFEDVDSIAVNPFNGTVYLAAFDSGTAGNVDASGDTEGDLDLYRIDFQTILDDYVSNGRARGTLYGPSVDPTGSSNVDHPSAGANTVHIGGAIEKIGEVARTQGSGFFDRDLEFVDPATLVIMDNSRDNSLTQPDADLELRVLERVSTSAGAASVSLNSQGAGSHEGGYNAAANTESWESDFAARFNMDFDSGTGLPVGVSEVEDIALAIQDGVVGVWVGESDGGGDDLGFFELSNISSAGLDAVASLSTIDSTGTTRGLDEDPEADPSTNDGDHDFIKVDGDGNLIIGESGFFDATPGGENGAGGNPSAEPTFIRLNIDEYQAGNVNTTTGDVWDDVGDNNGVAGFGDEGSDTADDNLAGPLQIEGPNGSFDNPFSGGTGLGVDDDTNVTDGRFATYDPGTNYLYLFDIDSGSAPNVQADVYVLDLSTGEIVYEEQNAVNHFMIEHGIRSFTRGDTDYNGLVNGDDIDFVFAQFTGTALAQEQFDLTGDLSVSSADVDELVEDILGTEYGDANLDGSVDLLDFGVWRASFLGGSGDLGWADGSFNGDLAVDLVDFGIWRASFLGTGGSPALAALATEEAFALATVPEPASLALLGMGGLLAMRRRRQA